MLQASDVIGVFGMATVDYYPAIFSPEVCKRNRAFTVGRRITQCRRIWVWHVHHCHILEPILRQPKEEFTHGLTNATWICSLLPIFFSFFRKIMFLFLLLVQSLGHHHGTRCSIRCSTPKLCSVHYSFHCSINWPRCLCLSFRAVNILKPAPEVRNGCIPLQW